MGSVRKPVGPLPSSIYWRRRAISLCLLALLALPAVWVLVSGAGGDDGGDRAEDRAPVSTITPGSSPSGSADSRRPGGRETSEGSAGGSTGDDAAGSTDGAPDGDAGVTGGQADSAGATGGGATDPGGRLPAGSPVPDCTANGVRLVFRSVELSYEPDEKPEFELTAENSSGTACKLDFGSTAAVISITGTSDEEPVWVSDDCPNNKESYLVRVPAGGKSGYHFEWDRKTGSPQCATPDGGAVPPGTYLVEAKLPGFKVKQTSFVLREA